MIGGQAEDGRRLDTVEVFDTASGWQAAPSLQTARQVRNVLSTAHSRMNCVPNTFQPSRNSSPEWHGGWNGIGGGIVLSVSTVISARMKRVQGHVSPVNMFRGT